MSGMRPPAPLAAPCLLWLAACGGSPAPAGATLIAGEQPGVLLSAWVAPDGTAYLAGGVTGGDGLLLRWDGKTLATLPTPGAHAFWWIHGLAAGDVWLAGERGEVHRFDGSTLTPVDVGAPPDATLFGVWGPSDEDLWAVGGGLPGQSGGIIRRRANGAWTAIGAPAGVDAGVAYYKVWGAATADAWIVGDAGTVLHWDGATLSRFPAPAAEACFTVHGCAADDVYAVGGGAQGVALHFDGSAWSAIALDPIERLNGVACAGGIAYVGGFGGTLGRIAGGRFQRIAVPASVESLMIHGLFVPAAGKPVAAGGDLAASGPDPRRGFALGLPR